MSLLCPLLRLVRAYRFTSVVTPWGYKSRRSPLCTPTSSRIIHHSLLTSFPMPEKKEREKEENEKKERKGNYRDLGSVASPSFSSHGRTRLDPFQGYTVSPAKPHEARVHECDRACGLSRARGPHVPRTRGRIRGDLCDIL
jgi:hypothetical protein